MDVFALRDDVRRTRHHLFVSIDTEILLNVQAAVDEHDRDCPQPIKCVLLNPGDLALLGWNELLGLPVLACPGVEPKRFKLVCGAGRAGEVDGAPVVWTPDGSPWQVEPPT